MKEWIDESKRIKRFTTRSRIPFYKAIHPYLPNDVKQTIVDIGAGDGTFGKFLNEHYEYKNIFAVEQNKHNKELLQEWYSAVIWYDASSRLPFDDGCVDFIHTSHLIEHLNPDDLLSLLAEIDRVLKNKSHLVISTPMLWDGFYENLTHVKPYHSGAILRYMSFAHKLHTREIVSSNYISEGILYRYRKSHVLQNIASEVLFAHFLVRLLQFFLTKLKIFRYEKYGYTIILKKNDR